MITAAYLELSIEIRLRLNACDEVLTCFSDVNSRIQQRLTRLIMKTTHHPTTTRLKKNLTRKSGDNLGQFLTNFRKKFHRYKQNEIRENSRSNFHHTLNL